MDPSLCTASFPLPPGYTARLITMTRRLHELTYVFHLIVLDPRCDEFLHLLRFCVAVPRGSPHAASILTT
ncbi:hypothetical protein VTO73DRAFT_4224 [Trametes versicolor]